MSEHQMKEALQKSTHKPRVSAQNTPTTAEGANDELIRLQRLVGNQAVQRLLANGDVEAPRSNMVIQAKMTVGAADDPYEKEADAVAAQVMAKRDIVQREAEEDELQMKRIQRAEEEEELQMKRMPNIQREGEEDELQMKRIQRAEEEEELQMKRMPNIQRVGEEDELQMKRVDTIQREGEEDELQMKRIQRVEEEDELQMKRIQRVDEEKVDMSGSFDVNADVESQISAASGSGQGIPDVHRELFESSMGHDFSGVNIHADAQSDSLNQQLGARAFTTGSDIFFRQGEYNPGSSGGQELLAHELTHVVQQGAAGVQKKKEDEA
jgi:hypothetical protein